MVFNFVVEDGLAGGLLSVVVINAHIATAVNCCGERGIYGRV